MLQLQATNELELLKILAETDISVPRRSEDRTKDHTERYAIAHLLSALAGKDRISYPLILTQRNRPDFLLTSDTTKIGIEHTEAVPENEAHKTVLREKRYAPDEYFISHHKPGEPKKHKKELIKEIVTNRAGASWVGDSMEREWAEAMFHFIERKVVSLLKDGFDRFDLDWLLIYDNWNPAVDRYKAATFLLKFVTENGVLQNFERIFIITGEYVCEIATAGMQFFYVNDLWN